MRLTADLVLRADAYLNALLDRELNLRAYKIGVIENLGACGDHFDSIDLSDNEIGALGNFPRLRRLRSLQLCNNEIERIDSDLGAQLASLETLVLSYNRIRSVAALAPLASCARLEFLSLVGNPVVQTKNYRLAVIGMLEGLKTLDFRRVQDKEREEARKLRRDGGAAGDAALVFTPGEAGRPEKKASLLDAFSAEQRKLIRRAIEQADDVDAIEKIERALRAGQLPDACAALPPPEAAEGMAREAAGDGKGSEAAEDGKGGEAAEKGKDGEEGAESNAESNAEGGAAEGGAAAEGAGEDGAEAAAAPPAKRGRRRQGRAEAGAGAGRPKRARRSAAPALDID